MSLGARMHTVRMTLIAFMVAIPLLVAVRPVGAADVIGASGTITDIPGFPGKQLKYRVGAVKTSDKTAHFWLQLKNENDMEIKVIVCGMLNLIFWDIDDRDYKIKKTSDTPPKWTCTRTIPDPGPGMPSYHFGCKRVTIPANSKIDVFDQIATFSQSINNESPLGKVYFDLLKDCEIDPSCEQIKGSDSFLVPEEPSGHADWVNIWAGASDYIDLTGTGLSETEWPHGNWVTMDKERAEPFPARLTGTVSGAVAASVIRFTFNLEPGGTYVVPPDPKNPPCGGLDVAINEPFVVQSGANAMIDGMALQVPVGPCGLVPEGSVMRFHGVITAEPGAPVYDPGDFMYGVDMVFVKDSVAPIIESVQVMQQGTSLHIRVEATDETTMAIGATFVYFVGEQGGEIPIGYADPASAEDLMFFEDDLEGLPTGVPITYHVDVYDDVGNVASSPTETIVLVP